MKFHKTNINGVFIIELEKKADPRGFLMRTFDKQEFKRNDIEFDIKQTYISHSIKKGTMRGLHYQISPFAEAKLTKCLKGEIYESVIDLREESKTYGKWQGFKLNETDNRMLYIPGMTGHGFLTLSDDCYFLNLSDMEYNGKFEKGIRFDDKFFNIEWPLNPSEVSGKDRSWPDFKLNI